MSQSIIALCMVSLTVCHALAAPGDWPEPRHDACLTAIQPVCGDMDEAPRLSARYDLGRLRPSITSVTQADGAGEVGLCIVSGSLLCFDTQGHLLWKSHPRGLNFTSIRAKEDLDGDGSKEVLLAAGRPAEPYAATVLVSLATGKTLWRYDVEPMSYAWYLYTDHYLPGEKSKQIVVIMQGFPPDKDNGYMVLLHYPNPGAAPKQKWRYDFHDYTCFPTFLRSDLDGDGVDELVIVSHSRMWFLDAVTGRMKHFVKWDVSPANVRSFGHVRFIDLNGDRRDDFLCIADFSQHHEVLLNRNGKMEKAWHHGWQASVTTGKIVTTWPEPTHTDVDGDGSLEIVVSMFNSEGDQTWLVRVYDAVTGKLKYRHSGMIAVRCVDIDGDGAAEIIGNISSDPTQTRLEGAQLLGVRDGRLQILWQDHKAEALDMLPLRTKRGKRIITDNRLPVHQPARIKREQGIFTLTRDRRGRTRLNSWRAPERKPGSDFSAVPAVLGAAMPALLAADLTGDGTNELVLYKTPEVQVLHFTGNNLDLVAKYKSDSIPVLADLNGDGQTEMVCMTVSTTTTPVVEAVTPALGNKRLWQCVFPKADRSGLPASKKAYIRTIHLTGQPTPDLYVWAGTPLVRSVGLNGLTGKILWEKGEMPDSPSRHYSRYYGPSMNYASACDFNEDGKEDLVFTNPDYYCVADGPTADLLLGPLFPKEIFNQPSQGLYTYPAILQTKGAIPTVCLVAGHYFQAAMSLRADPYWHELPMAGENRCAMEGFLQLDDGTWLMGFGRQNGNFVCKNALTGATRWEMPLQASLSDVVTCDVDGDGRSEYLFGTSHGDLCAVGDGGDRPRVVWKMDLGVAVGSPIAADLDGDGSCEVAVPTADGYVRVLDNS